jgi:hypothetical protein
MTGGRAIGRSDDGTVGRSRGCGLDSRRGPTLWCGRVTLWVALLAAAPHALAAQLHGQHWEVTPVTTRPTVGDTITLAFRVRLDERDLLFDTVPKPSLTPPDWIRVFSIEKLQRQPDRIFTGRARIAFYRPGRQAVPVFELPFMRSVKGLERGTLTSDSASVEVVPVLTVGSSATLRDIKEPPPPRGNAPFELLLGLAGLGVAGWLAWRARPHLPTETAAVAAAVVPPPPPDPYDRTLARLAAIEAERWATRDVARHYAEITDALRDYLAAAEGIPARERTSGELLGSLPLHLSASVLRRSCAGVLGAADLVKFARRRPDADTAAEFLGDARALLAGWRCATPAGEVADAIR